MSDPQDLWDALKANSYAKLKSLLESGADVKDATKQDGWSLLHEAAYHKGNLRMVKLLLQHNADVNAKYYNTFFLRTLSYPYLTQGGQDELDSTAQCCDLRRQVAGRGTAQAGGRPECEGDEAGYWRRRGILSQGDGRNDRVQTHASVHE